MLAYKQSVHEANKKRKEMNRNKVCVKPSCLNRRAFGCLCIPSLLNQSFLLFLMRLYLQASQYLIKFQSLLSLQALYLQQLRELMSSCDQTAKTVAISYFQLHYSLFAPLPIQVSSFSLLFFVTFKANHPKS